LVLYCSLRRQIEEKGGSLHAKRGHRPENKDGEKSFKTQKKILGIRRIPDGNPCILFCGQTRGKRDRVLIENLGGENVKLQKKTEVTKYDRGDVWYKKKVLLGD